MSPEVEQHGTVAIVRSGNPGSRSRWSPASESALFDRLAQVEADPAVRVIVVAGSTAAIRGLEIDRGN
jgi:enoyl-CoA hydratase/carnithine racemase